MLISSCISPLSFFSCGVKIFIERDKPYNVLTSPLLNICSLLLIYALVPSSLLLSIGNSMRDSNKKVSFHIVSILWLAGLAGLHSIELGVQLRVSMGL